MYCRHCGKQIEDGSAYCIFCGGTLKKEVSGGRLYAHELTRLKMPVATKNPGAAAAIGFFLGWILLGPVGYAYLGQWNWFWLTFVIQIFAIPLTAGVAYIMLPVLYAIHQYQMANEINGMLEAARAERQARSGEEEGIPAGEV